MAASSNHSFDIVSEVNEVELHNAIQQARHEVAVRYDFKGTKAGIEYDKKNRCLTLTADHQGQLEAVVMVLKEKMLKRGVDHRALKRGKIEEASHDTVREVVTFHRGIEADDARKIVKEIKAMGLKVQAQIMDEKVRVTGKKIDDLQAVIAHLRKNGPEYPLQFENFT
ncbi:protein of unknown function DUF520 [Isosphaera pallida ATCC 43644]|jgi:uncharacterized protein YajQ (UPF0234 family)|uniref:Nucleotide-binding protein Isop_3477 n=1 Tax=Isosphaera pallida (strain ATCC 43644 / DSM 9630 / IS1B) TaxID=575540 RepID=E8QWZ5_ISOPI|nr:YajQ family cyclic di-GMP-binding protein [Isosphaera pallida]ADV64034.1 protein of unknown function DUF520 [Isosphaera pallida ATCC 43644]